MSFRRLREFSLMNATHYQRTRETTSTAFSFRSMHSALQSRLRPDPTIHRQCGRPVPTRCTLRQTPCGACCGDMNRQWGCSIQTLQQTCCLSAVMIQPSLECLPDLRSALYGIKLTGCSKYTLGPRVSVLQFSTHSMSWSQRGLINGLLDTWS